jgi:hypothetical protein
MEEIVLCEGANGKSRIIMELKPGTRPVEFERSLKCPALIISTDVIF